MRAAIVVEQNAPLLLADVEMPVLGVGHVAVSIHWSGICGKQLEEISGKRGADQFLPHLLGHEGAGEVVAVGPGVTKVQPGDHVVLHWMKGSGINASPPTFTRDGGRVNAGWVTTFSEQTVVSENRVTPIPKDLKLDVACLLGCAVTTGLGIVTRDAGLTPGQSLAVFGVGGVGLSVIQGAALVSAYPIVAIDRHDHKLEQAKALGATHTVHAERDDVPAVLRALSQDQGFDVTVEAIGNTEVIEQAYQLTKATGKTIIAGVIDHRARIMIDSFPLHFGRLILGSHGGNTQPDVDIPRYAQLYQVGRLKLDELITHRYPLDRINDAIEVVRRGETGKCLLSMRGGSHA